MANRNYIALRTAEDVKKQVGRVLSSGKPIAYDIEAGYVGEPKEGVSLQQFHPDYIVVGFSFTDSVNYAFYIPFAHDDGKNVDDVKRTARLLWMMLSTGRGVAHNHAYELKGMSRFFREQLWNDDALVPGKEETFSQQVRKTNGLYPILSDTQLEVWLAAAYNPVTIGKGLKQVSKAAFGLIQTEFDDLFPVEYTSMELKQAGGVQRQTDLGPLMKRGKGRFNRFNTRNSEHPEVIKYACEDSVACLMIHQKHYAELKDQNIFKLELQLMPVLVEMEMGPCDPDTGKSLGNFLMDWSLLHKKTRELEVFEDKYRRELLADFSRRLDREINLNLGSPKQLATILYEPKPEGLGLPARVRSEKTGAPSTSEEALKAIAAVDPVVQKLLNWRSVNKLLTSYLLKFENELAYDPNGYVYPNHNQMGALTGRFSVDTVSYQQWPKPYHFELDSGDSFHFNLRELFLAPPGFRVVGFDWANVEMRIAGALAGETAIIDAFNNDQDLHKASAAIMFRVPFDQVTKEQRSKAKTFNFAILYGAQAGKIASTFTDAGMPTSKEEAEQMLRDYLNGYSNLAKWFETQAEESHRTQFVTTKLGRRFKIWEYDSPLRGIQAKGERMSVNAPVQGSAADLMKLSLVRAQHAIKKKGLADKIRTVLTVHDAIEWYVHESIPTQDVLDLLMPYVNYMPGLPAPIDFPLEIRADWHEGKTWGSAIDIVLDENKRIVGYEIETKQGMHKFDTYEEALEFQDKEAEALNALPAPVEEEQAEGDDEPPWLHARDSIAIIALQEMPDEARWAEFKEWLRPATSGLEIQVETPHGSTKLDGKFAISLADKPLIALLLEGAELTIGTVDVAE